MESKPPLQTETLASILDAEKVMQPARARTLLTSLAEANALPTGPSTPREWAEQVLVIAAPNGVERAEFLVQPGAPKPLPDWAAHVLRLVDALRAAAIAMLWGIDGEDASADRRASPDGQPRFPRLHNLLIEQWAATRNTCNSTDKFMMFFEATLALDRAAEPKVGREAFRTLSLQALDARKKNVRVGTIGVPFAAIIDTGKFQKAARAAPANAASPNPQSVHSTSPVNSAALPAPAPRSALRMFIGTFGIHIAIVIAVAIAVLYWKR